MKLGLAVLIAVGLASVRLAAAAPPDAARESRAAFQAAEAHFKAGEFDEALAKYRAGYDAKPLPGFLINIAQCQRRLGDLKGARVTYGKFVLVAPDSPLVPQAREMIVELDRLLAEEEASQPPAARESVTVAPPIAAQPPAPEPAPPPPPASNPMLVQASSSAAPEPTSGGTRWWLWGAIGAAVIGGTVAVFALSGGDPTIVDHGSLGTLRR